MCMCPQIIIIKTPVKNVHLYVAGQKANVKNNTQ